MGGQIDDPDPAVLFDEVTSWKVKSRTDPHVEYVCELKTYKGNGSCLCDDFNMRFAKLLGLGITPEAALEQKLVELRRGFRTTDALRCWHLVHAFTEFEQHMVRVFSYAAKKTKSQEY